MSKVPTHKTDSEKKAVWIGITITLIFHISGLVLSVNSGFKTTYPPPNEVGILIEFEQEPPKPILTERGIEPKAVKVKPEEEVKLIQKSEATKIGNKADAGAETTMADDGDIEKYEASRPKPINKRALFSSANNNKDSIAAQTAEKISERLKAGNPQGNTIIGNTTDKPMAKLKGRSSVGNLPSPEYAVNKSGKVVVKIMVDQYGSITNAIPGAEGTTVQDRILWEAARKAALKAKFNISSNAPIIQEGSITYVFRLR